MRERRDHRQLGQDADGGGGAAAQGQPNPSCRGSASAADRKAFLDDHPELTDKQLARVCPDLFPDGYLKPADRAKQDAAATKALQKTTSSADRRPRVHAVAMRVRLRGRGAARKHPGSRTLGISGRRCGPQHHDGHQHAGRRRSDLTPTAQREIQTTNPSVAAMTRPMPAQSYRSASANSATSARTAPAGSAASAAARTSRVPTMTPCAPGPRGRVGVLRRGDAEADRDGHPRAGAGPAPRSPPGRRPARPARPWSR